MPSPAYYVFDGDPENDVLPQRPTVDDLGGAQFVDDLEHPPDPGVTTMAEEENQQEKVLAGLGQTAFVLAVQVTFTGGAPVLAGFSAVGTLWSTEDFTLDDDGDGNTHVKFDRTKLPQPVLGPLVAINEDVEIDRVRVMFTSEGIRVKTKLGATGTDAGFTAFIP